MAAFKQVFGTRTVLPKTGQAVAIEQETVGQLFLWWTKENRWGRGCNCLKKFIKLNSPFKSMVLCGCEEDFWRLASPLLNGGCQQIRARKEPCAVVQTLARNVAQNQNYEKN
jgi:hypothetical protein